jgi:hypothetical protein
LEKRYYTEKTISKLIITDEGEEIEDIKDILDEQKNVYENHKKTETYRMST